MISQETIDAHHKRCRESLARSGDGPWTKEPDRVNWTHAGLDCMAVRNETLGHWCGYVGVKEGHPAFDKEYDEVPVEAHGGLTYSAFCGNNICHITEGDDKTYWLGFDCAHCFDLSPAMGIGSGEYRDLNFVTEETQRLARQLSELKK